MARTVTIDELKALVGQELGVSGWQTIDQALVDRFADVTGDHQYIHCDPERAAQTPFGGTIAHGLLLLSLLPAALMEHAVEPEGTRMAINYGYEGVRFLAPVRCGSEVRVRFAIRDVTEKDASQVRVTYDATIEVRGQEKPALVAQNIGAFMRG